MRRIGVAITLIAVVVACAHRAPTPTTVLPSDPTQLDLAGTWEVVFHVTKRGEMRDSTRSTRTSTAAGRMELSPFQQPPPNPPYPLYKDWPRWAGVIHAPFASLLQVPPFTLGYSDHVTQDSLLVGAWVESGRIRLELVGDGCSDCGNIEATGSLRRDDIGGRWSQEFAGTGDAGTWSMHRVHDTANGDKP